MSWEIEEGIFEPGKTKKKVGKANNSSLSNFTLSEAHLKLSYLDSSRRIATCEECDQEFPLSSFFDSNDPVSQDSILEYRCPLCGGPLIFEG